MLTSRPFNNSCRIFCQEERLELGLVGELLGFGPNKSITKNTFVDSNTVDVNLGVRSINIACSLVNSSRNWNRYQKGSQVIATLPVSTEVPLNGSIEKFATQTWTSLTRGVEFSFLEFKVEDNTRHNLVRLYIEFHCTFS